MELVKTVCYEDFGAVGDGKTDDFDAIKRAHEYANENRLDVVTDGSKTYYIGDTTIDVAEKKAKAPIEIKTNVDWNTSRFIIDDSTITSDMPARWTLIFKVVREHPIAYYTADEDTPNGFIARINSEGGFKTDIRKFDIGIGYEALLYVRDDSKRVYIRYGPNKNPGEGQNELIYVDKDGNIDPDTPFLLDYDAVTSIKAVRTDDAPLTIRGGIFTTIANQAPEDYKYYNRGLSIARSNVTVEKLTYKIAGEGDHGDPYAAFVDVIEAANVVIQNCSFQAHKYYMCVGSGGGAPVGMGTYAISAHDANKVTWRRCSQSNFFTPDGKVRRYIWDIMGSSGCKNLSYEDSLLSRLDAHAGMYNANVSHSTLTCIALSGGGDLKVENSDVYSNTLIEMRSDYGSSWNGKIYVKDVTMHNSDVACIFRCGWFNHDFGFKTHVPEEIVIDGLRLTTPTDIHIFPEKYVERIAQAHLDEIDGEPNLNKTAPPKRIVIKNNKGKYKFIIPDNEFFKNTEFIIED